MNKSHFIQLIGYPKEWSDWGYLPDTYIADQIKDYLSEHRADQPKSGDVPGSEHYRFGAFLYWLKQEPQIDQLEKLLALTYLDKDQLMANDVRRRIARARFASPEMLLLADEKYK